MFFSTAIVPKRSSIKGAFSDKHGLRFRQTWSIPTMYPNFGNIGHVSRFWIHCYFWPISRQGLSLLPKWPCEVQKNPPLCASNAVVTGAPPRIHGRRHSRLRRLVVVGDAPLGRNGYPLVMTNIAMENGPFIDGLPTKSGDFPWLWHK